MVSSDHNQTVYGKGKREEEKNKNKNKKIYIRICPYSPQGI
jgi:hypothetical protein